MIQLHIDDRVYHVEFRHTRRLGRILPDGHRPELPIARGHIRAITTCAITVVEVMYNVASNSYASEIRFTAIGTAVCANEDAFARQTGRHIAFSKAVTQCGALRNKKIALMAAYLEIDPPPCYEVAEKLTPLQKTAMWEAGWEKRKQREAAKAARSAS